MLERLAGHWTWTGQQANIGAENSPYGQAGRFVGSGDSRLIMDGQFILDKYQEKSPEGNLMHGISLISYDPVKKCFVARDCMSDGSTSIAEITIDGRVRKDHITITSKTGETLLARVAGEYSPDWKRLEQTWEGSTDNGASWKHWCTAVFEKPDGPVSDEQELIRLQQEWSRAEVAGDVRTVDRLLADEYVITTSDGRSMPKAEYLRGAASEDTRSIAMSVEGTKVQLYGDMALAKGIVKWTEPGGKKHENLFSETWQKRDGRWQCLATHESEVEQTVDSAQLSPEMKKLEGFVGTWEYEGEQVDPPIAGLPFGGAGTFSGAVTNRFILDGSFMESTIEDKSPGGLTRTVQLTGYDPKTRRYVLETFMSDGTREHAVQTVSPDGRVWTSQSTMTSGTGEQALLRNVATFSPDRSKLTSVVDVSTDGGQTWKHWFTSRDKKVDH